jgi:Flp pilus assembly protein TadD
MQLVGVLDRQKKFAEAAEAARTATEVDAGNAEAWRRLGTSLVQDAQPKPAREAFERAIELAPGQWSTHFNLGLIQWDAREDEAAVASFARAADLAPTQPEPLQFGARALRRLGRPQEALLLDVRALAAQPRDWRQWMIAATQLGDLGWSDAAITFAAKATAVGPDQAPAWSRLAEVLLDSKTVDAPRAMAAAKRAEELAKAPDARFTWVMARAEAANGDVPAAIARLEALLAEPKVPAGVRELAEAELAKLRTK